MHGLDLLDQLGLPPGPRALGPSAPRAVAAAGHAQDRAHQLHGELIVMFVDECELRGSSLAKKAVAFFRISRSSVSRRFSSRRRAFSASRAAGASPGGPEA